MAHLRVQEVYQTKEIDRSECLWIHEMITLGKRFRNHGHLAEMKLIAVATVLLWFIMIGGTACTGEAEP